MSKLLRWSVSGVGAALVMGICATSFAAVTFTLAPYARQNAAVTYGSGAGDYQSRSDTFGSTGPSGNDLAGVNSFQGAPGNPVGIGNTTVGIGELVTPLSGGTYGAPNNHGFAVNTITLPLAGTTTVSSVDTPITVTLNILQGFLSNGDGVTPVAPNDAANTDTWVTQSTVFSDTFTWDNPNGTASLATFDLTGRGVSLALGTSYIVGFQWHSDSSGTENNFLVIDRGPQVDPGGQYMGFTGTTSGGWSTSAKLPFSAGAPRTGAISFNVPPATPEPASLVLLGLAVPALGWAVRRRKA